MLYCASDPFCIAWLVATYHPFLLFSQDICLDCIFDFLQNNYDWYAHDDSAGRDYKSFRCLVHEHLLGCLCCIACLSYFGLKLSHGRYGFYRSFLALAGSTASPRTRGISESHPLRIRPDRACFVAKRSSTPRPKHCVSGLVRQSPDTADSADPCHSSRHFNTARASCGGVFIYINNGC